MECFDCHQQVADLKSHRSVCLNRKGPQGKWGSAFSAGSGGYGTQGSAVAVVATGGGKGAKKKFSKVASHGAQGDAMGAANVSMASSSPSSSSSLLSTSSQRRAEGTKDVFVLMDVSGSMSGARLASAKAWVQEIEQMLQENDRFSLLSFDSKAFLKLHLKPVGKLRRKGELVSILDSIYAGNSTACYDAMCLAMEQVLSSDARETHLVVISDGEDNASRSTALAEVRQHMAEKPNIHVHFLQIASDYPIHRELAVSTGGLFIPIDPRTSTASQVPDELRNVLQAPEHPL